MSNFRKPSQFSGDIESRVSSLERTQRTQDVEINRIDAISNQVRSNIFTEYDGVTLTGASLLSAMGAGVGDVVQAYNADVTSCPAGKLIGRAAGGSAGPVQDISVGTGLTMVTDTLSFSPGDNSIAVGKIGPVSASQVLGRDGAAGSGGCQNIDIGDGLSISSNTLLVPAAGLTLDRIQDISQARLLGRDNTSSGPVEELTFGTGLVVSAGAVQQDMLFRMLDKDENAQNIGTAQPWFPALGTVDVEIATYMFDGVLMLTTGTTSHSLLLKFDSGTAVAANMGYCAIAQSVLESNNALAQSSTWSTSAGANTVLAASTTAARWVRVVGIVRFQSSGTFIPEFRFSAAPGGTNVVKVNTYFRMLRVGDDAVTAMGNWS